MKYRVVVFSKSYDSSSTRVKQMLDAEGINYHCFDLDTAVCSHPIHKDKSLRGSPGVAIQMELTRRSSKLIVPQVFVQGSFVGDCKQIMKLEQSGGLRAYFEKIADESTP